MELTYLASVLFVYGQFCVSTHASSMGLFKPEVFLAHAVLTNTAGFLAKPPTVLTATEDPDITAKLHQMIENGRAKLISGSPHITNVPKNKGPPRVLAFELKSKILQYLLSSSDKTLKDLTEVSDNISIDKQDLEKVLVAKEDEAKYEVMIEETKALMKEVQYRIIKSDQEIGHMMKVNLVKDAVSLIRSPQRAQTRKDNKIKAKEFAENTITKY